jgi:hypothetical protein
VLTLVDAASDRAPAGARGHRVMLTREAAEAALPSLLGMAVDYRPGWDGHDARRKIGLLTEANLIGQRLAVRGYLYARDFPEVAGAIQAHAPEAMGMSYELANARVEDMRAECFDFGLRAYSRCAVFWRFCPSCSEFLAEPFENGVLFIQPGASDLREQPNRTGFLMRHVLCALVARGAQRTEIRQFLLAAEALVYDVADVKPDLTASRWVDVARGKTAHLASKSVAVQNRGP